MQINNSSYFKVLFILLLVVFLYACRKADTAYNNPEDEWLSGGKQTFFDVSNGAFSHSFKGLSAVEVFNHDEGDAAFEASFVTAPAPVNGGLGPLYNNISCIGCHQADGRGKPPLAGQALSSMLFRISVPGVDEHGGPNPVQGFGGQLQTRSIAGAQAEGDVQISYSTITGVYADGKPYSLRQPIYTIINPYTNLPVAVMLSPRVAPPVFGLGLLEAIPDCRLLELADEFDSDQDGISGKVNWVYDVLSNSKKIGKFGWKCGQPSILQQSAGAYNEDMGITNYIFSKESSYGQAQHQQSNQVDLSDSLLHAAAFYMQTLGVPARRNIDNTEVQRGKVIFNNLKCNACHVASQNTKVDVTFPSRSNQKIFPYTDMLLHDMGAGLADNRPEYLANGNEWRTPALWGIGLTFKVNGHQNFLHDGRARNLSEAILWHGGEAENSKNSFIKLAEVDRNALIKFLESL